MESLESSTRELTVEEAVSAAILLQKNEQLAEAHHLYRRVPASGRTVTRPATTRTITSGELPTNVTWGVRR